MGDGIPPAGSALHGPLRDRQGEPAGADALRARLAAAGRALGEREAAHRAALAAARSRCEALHALARDALDAFHAAAERAGAPHLRIELGSPRLDEKHVRAYEFELRRGRHVGLVIAKSRGEVTLVGPFRTGKDEGPCRSLPFDAAADIERALGEFLERLVEEAATP
jgi:hypothetical protein